MGIFFNFINLGNIAFLINKLNFVTQLYLFYSEKANICEYTEIEIAVTKKYLYILFPEGFPE